jgi:hypothetical protein
MDDALLVRRFKGFGDLPRDGQRLVERNRTPRDPLRQVLAFDEFQHERAHAAGIFQAVDMRDVRMIEGGERLRFARKPGQAIGIAGEGVRKDLQRDVAIQLRIVRSIHLTHSACAESGQNLIRADSGAGGEGQRSGIIVPDSSPTGLLLSDGRTVSRVTRRRSVERVRRRCAASLSIQPFERSRWRLRRTRSISMGVELSGGGGGRADRWQFPVPGD